jgi:mRNA interferase MazF
MLKMLTMTTFKFGDVVLVPFPFTNQTSAKKRPAVVVSSEVYHQTHPDVIVMAITSQIQRALLADNVMVTDWQGAGLLKPSVIKPIISTIEKGLVLKKLGSLQDSDLQGLQEVLRIILGV